MAGFEGPKITKTRGGLGRREPTTDGIFGLVCGGVTTAEYATLGTIVKLIQAEDADNYGFTAAYDSTNKVLVRHHIDRYFQYHPSGTLYLMVVAQTVTLAQMCDKDLAYVYKMATDESTNREIKVIGVVLNPDTEEYTPTYTNGLDADALAAITKAQALCVDLFNRAIFLDQIMIEGQLAANATISTLPNLRALASEYASVVIAQDPTTAELDAAYARYADVGSALGMLSVRKVSECLGSVDIANKPDSARGQETYPLTVAALSYWTSAQLSSGAKFSALSVAQQEALESKGYIYAGKFEGLDGYFFNDSHTAITVSDDYAYIEDTRVFNKAARLVRRALLPVMKGEVEVDSATGFLPASVVSYYEAKALKSLVPMSQASEISGEGLVRIEPNQDVVGTGTIVMQVQYSRKGILRDLEAQVGAINPAAAS